MCCKPCIILKDIRYIKIYKVKKLQFFNLFNNEESGVNWELAKQINNHITKDEEVLPPELSNNDINFEQIFRVIELQSEELLSYESSPKEIRLMTPKEYGQWFIESIKHFDFESIDSMPSKKIH